MMVEDEGEETPSKSKPSTGSSSYKSWKYATSFQKDLMAGAVMGGVVHTIVAPIERAKLLLQTQESNIAIGVGKHRKFKGMFDCIVSMVKEEGFVSLWRGNGSSVLRYYPSVALNFSLKDLYRDVLKNDNEGPPIMTGAAANFFAGAAAGCTTLMIVYPLDIAHTRLAADIGKADARQFRGIYHFLSTIYRVEGIRGLYRGLPASFHGMVIHRGLYFGGFDTVKDVLAKDAVELALWKRWLAAQVVTTSAGFISYPFDTVRRRMMMQSGLKEPMYRKTFDCWKTIYRTEGLSSFYRGAVSNMFRSTGAAAILVLYDEVKKFMHWGGSTSSRN
ncbi:probable ADP,ATP carrier protein At5g56450 [Chenopodium quinoa]|uniref:ADP/ATP translocase n=1 Tax=Chenopodium quinoa TaxID=63459 RepID=A0A803NDW2_CHEQI|nr:probable ADP,ATP carrier protein At5g56450 [Chenopodium quinoa]